MNRLFIFFLRTLPRPLMIRMSYALKGAVRLYFKGDKYQCPITEEKFRKFLPYGQHQRRDNVLCPGDFCLERHRILWLYLQRETNFFSTPAKMLHVAPEQCFLDHFKAMKKLEYITADLISPIADVKMDLHDIPFGDNTFNVIFCNHVLEHVEDDHRCMSELYRVLKPGGFAVLGVPIDYNREETLEDPNIKTEKDREKYYWQKDHVRLFGRDYIKKLEKAGFEAEEIDYYKQLKKEEQDLYRLSKNEKIYIGRK